MAARFYPVAGLDQMVALMVAPEVRSIANDARDVAKALAPDGKTWVTQGDHKVRPTHVEAGADGFNHNVPDNLRFRLRSMDWDMNDAESNHLGASTWMQHPKDWTSGAVANIKQCRCTSAHDKHVIRDGIKTGPTTVVGAKVTVNVVATGHRIEASEFGESYGGEVPPAIGLHWMGRAAAMVAASGRR